MSKYTRENTYYHIHVDGPATACDHNKNSFGANPRDAYAQVRRKQTEFPGCKIQIIRNTERVTTESETEELSVADLAKLAACHADL